MSNLNQAGVLIRKAIMPDVLRMQNIINFHASSGVMLPKSLNQLYENLRDFIVLEKDGEVVACGALHFFWEDLAEIRSLAVDPDHAKNGYGAMIVETLVEQAKDFKIKRVFCLTLVEKFFGKLGFTEVPHSELPQKVYKDCINCVKLGRCDEIAMVRDA
ncbi:MAG: N-acetyltransferase [Vampirovibrionia bacterium]